MATSTSRYEVTASKYRPKTFDELAGQEFVVSTIKNSLKSGHIANAYLFSGPRGCGKTSAARILARSLNCEKGAEAGPCCSTHAGGMDADICDNCLAISRGSSMDVLEIDGASNNSVNDVRQIKDEVLFPPQSG
ncbi:MAG: AAA family ATPase, partial [Treponema sp.]|nr:AAA family ATPase [Treponema sp.]